MKHNFRLPFILIVIFFGFNLKAQVSEHFHRLLFYHTMPGLDPQIRNFITKDGGQNLREQDLYSRVISIYSERHEEPANRDSITYKYGSNRGKSYTIPVYPWEKMDQFPYDTLHLFIEDSEGDLQQDPFVSIKKYNEFGDISEIENLYITDGDTSTGDHEHFEYDGLQRLIYQYSALYLESRYFYTYPDDTTIEIVSDWKNYDEVSWKSNYKLIIHTNPLTGQIVNSLEYQPDADENLEIKRRKLYYYNAFSKLTDYYDDSFYDEAYHPLYHYQYQYNESYNLDTLNIFYNDVPSSRTFFSYDEIGNLENLMYQAYNFSTASFVNEWNDSIVTEAGNIIAYYAHEWIDGVWQSIGLERYHYESYTPVENMMTESVPLHLYPQPATEYINFDLYIEKTSDVVITIYSINGSKIYEAVFPLSMPGNQSFTIRTNVMNVKNDLCLYKIVAGDKLYKGKIMITG